MGMLLPEKQGTWMDPVWEYITGLPGYMDVNKIAGKINWIYKSTTTRIRSTVDPDYALVLTTGMAGAPQRKIVKAKGGPEFVPDGVKRELAKKAHNLGAKKYQLVMAGEVE